MLENIEALKKKQVESVEQRREESKTELKQA
jgi:hypothetical protein